MERFERFQVDMNLAFVIGRAAAEEIAIACFGKKRRRGPKIQGIGRLNVVMPIEKHRGFAGSFEGFGVDQRMKSGGNDFDGFEAGGAQVVGNPTGGALDVLLVLALGADRRNAKEIAQLVEMLLAMTLYNFSKVHGSASGTGNVLLIKIRNYFKESCAGGKDKNRST